MKNNKKLLAVLSVPAITTLLAVAISTPVKAANRDFHDKSTNPETIYSNKEYVSSDEKLASLIDALGDHPANIMYEFGGKEYAYNAFVDNYQKAYASGKGTADAFNSALTETPSIAIVTVASVAPVDSIAVDNGTTADKLTLPKTVEVTLSDGTKDTANVIWDTSKFDGTKAEDQTVTGTLSVPTGKTWTLTDAQKTVSAKVTVKAAISAVSSVTGVNKTSVDVKFAEAPATAPTADKFTVKVGDTVVPVTKVTAKAGTTDTFTLDVALDGKEGKVNVNGVDSAAFDYKAPEVASVTPISGRMFDVTFSEDVNAGLAQVLNNYSMVETGTANIVTMTGSTVTVKDSKTVRITLPASSALTKDKSYTISVKNMQDVSANKNTMTSSSSKAFTAIEDTTKPTMTSAKALDANKIEIDMNKEMDSSKSVTVSVKPYNTDGTLGSEVITSTGLTQDSVVVSGTKVTVTMNTANQAKYLANGTKYKVTVSAGSDLAGNPIADNQAMDIEGVRDVVAPTVVGQNYDSTTKKLTINFSEAVANLETASNYALFETETGIQYGGTVTPVAATDHKSVTLTFGTQLDANKAYSVRLKGDLTGGLKDEAITPNALANNTIVKFTTPVVITPVEIGTVSTPTLNNDGKTVFVKFNTSVLKAEAENVNNYSIVSADDSTKTLAVTKAVYDDSTNIVTLTTAAQEQKTYKVTVSGLTNMSSDATKLSKTFAGIDKVAPVFTSAKPITNKIIDLTFDSEVANNTIPSGDNASGKVTIVEKGTANVVATADASYVKNFDKNSVRLTLVSGSLTAGKSYTVATNGIEDIYGNASDSKSIDFTFTAADTTPAALTGVTVVNSGKITLQFDKELKTVGSLANYALKQGDTVIDLTDTTKYGTVTVAQNSDKTKVDIAAATGKEFLEDGKQYTISVSDKQGSSVTDVAGIATTDAAYTFTGVKDTVKPQLVSATAAKDNEIELTFSKELSNISAASDYVVTDAATGEPLTVHGVDYKKLSDNTTNKKVVVLTLDSGYKTQVGKTYRVYVKGDTIVDEAVVGNTLDDNYRVATFAGVDTTAPQFKEADLTSANTITLKFNEKLNPSTISADDFVLSNGSTVVSAVLDDSQTTITLKLDKALDSTAAPSSTTISIAANKSIEDIAGNKDRSDITVKGDLTSAIVDEAKPTVVKATQTGAKTIVLEFSENVAAISGVDASKVLTIPGYTVSSVSATGSDNKVTVTTDSTISGATTVQLVAGQTAIKDVSAANNVYAGGDNLTVVDGIAPSVSGLSLVDVNGNAFTSNTDQPTVTVSGTDINVALHGYTGNVKPGTATLSKDCGMTVDFAEEGRTDITFPVNIKTTDNLASLVLSALGTPDNGVTTATLYANSGSKVTLTDAAGNTVTYTLHVTL